MGSWRALALRRLLPAFAVAAALGLAPSAGADIISTTPTVEILPTPPGSVVAGDLEDDDLVRIFLEQESLLLGTDVPVDISLPGTYDSPGDAFLTSTVVPAGTIVNSYLIHFDQITAVFPDAGTISGSVTFDEIILGLIVLPGHGDTVLTLDLTDPILGAAGTIYPVGPAGDSRGLEEVGVGDPPAADVVILSADLHTVSFDFMTFEATDQIRVLTLVPEPSALALLALGLGGVALAARRRTRA